MTWLMYTELYIRTLETIVGDALTVHKEVG